MGGLLIALGACGAAAGHAPAPVEPADRPGSFTLTIDTWWGPSAFAAKGAVETQLATCGAEAT